MKRKKWTLVSSSHPIFNVWERETMSGDKYKGCFDKGINPNISESIPMYKEHVQIKKDPYRGKYKTL